MTLRTLILFLLLTASLAHAQDASRITRVTLYPGSATVERVARVAAGASHLELGGLPANFDIRTLRVEADAGIRLGEFTVRDLTRAEAPNPRQAELETKIQGVADQIAQLDVERQSAELVTNYLKGLGEPSEGNKVVAAEPRNLAATLEAIRRGGADALARMQRVAVQKRTLEQQQKALQAELAKVAEQSRDSRSITLNLAAGNAGDIRVSYQVNGPGWQPTYRATLDSANGTVELERQALIAQNSGEDWSNVSLRLSTGQPRSAVQGQAPRPWQLTIREPQPTMAYASYASPAPSMAPAAPVMMAKSANQPLFNVTELQGMFATEFEVPAKVSLPADGRKVTVQLSRVSVPVKLRIQAVPRQDVTAFLIASAERPQGVWLPGDIQLYRDSGYIGSTYWNAQQGDKLDLPFGRDDLVRISVAHTKAVRGSAGFIGSRAERQVADVYTVVNQHRQAVDLLLLEPTPVSGNDNIKVDKEFEPKPTQDNWDDKPGVAAWQQSLAAGATQKFSVSYRITWPKDSNVIGLP